MFVELVVVGIFFDGTFEMVVFDSLGGKKWLSKAPFSFKNIGVRNLGSVPVGCFPPDFAQRKRTHLGTTQPLAV